MNRREFLKLAGMTALLALEPKWFASHPTKQAPEGSPNIFIFVFDAMTARHLSLTGYPRATTPKLDQFIEKATIYHNHHASAPYTTPAVASLLTGTHVLSHRSFQLGEEARSFFTDANLFSVFDGLGYYTIAYTHNPMADVLLRQFQASLKTYKPREDLYLTRSPLLARLASKDFNVALQANQRILDTEQGLTNSLLISQLLAALQDVDSPRVAAYKAKFPKGLPGLQGDDIFFVLEEAIDWIIAALDSSPKPILGYFHFYPPHAPYHSREELLHRFRYDGFEPPEKPRHFSASDWTDKDLREMRLDYDEYYLYVDSEFDRMVRMLEEEGLLETSWIVFTSDHGELFERGIWGHTNLTLYQPLIHVPLIIKAPGQTTRQDIHQLTCAIDLLPTLQHIVSRRRESWYEGEILPPFGRQAEDPQRAVFTFNPRLSRSEDIVDKGIFTVIRWPYKLIYYFGHEELRGQPLLELYDIEADPEEMKDLTNEKPTLATNLFEELLVYIREHDKPD